MDKQANILLTYKSEAASRLFKADDSSRTRAEACWYIYTDKSHQARNDTTAPSACCWRNCTHTAPSFSFHYFITVRNVSLPAKNLQIIIIQIWGFTWFYEDFQHFHTHIKFMTQKTWCYNKNSPKNTFYINDSAANSKQQTTRYVIELSTRKHWDKANLRSVILVLEWNAKQNE